MYILQDLFSVTAPEVCNATVRELIQTQAQCERNVIKLFHHLSFAQYGQSVQ